MAPVSLPVPSTPQGRAGLDALLAEPLGAVVALDFDGTLSPIVDDPSAARAHPEAAAALARLAPLVGSVAVLTGRPAAVAVEYGGFAGRAGLDHLVVLGHYGRERWDARSGEVLAADIPPGVGRVRDALPRLLAEVGAPAGTSVEDKGASLAVHTRRTADPDAAIALLREPLADLASSAGLVVEPGRMVLELRPPGIDKGMALAAFALERGASVVLYAGDDLGDLAAFDAVDALRERGVPGLAVCAGSREVEALAARADLVVDGPEGVVGLIRGLADALHGRA